MSLNLSAKLLVGAFTVSGITHLVRPQTFEPLMPRYVPAHREVIWASGAVELLCAAGMLAPATRRPAGLASAGLLLAVWPGNLKMAMDSNRTRSTAYQVIAWGRMPLQIPLIRIALRAARS